MDFSIFGLCPFIAADMTGTYLVLANELGGFFGDNNMREVVGGPGENQFTILGGNVIDREGEDLIVEVDPVTDVASIASESIGRQAFTSPPSEFDLTGLYSGVDGLVFSCAGDVRLQIETDCCGARPFQMIKQ